MLKYGIEYLNNVYPDVAPEEMEMVKEIYSKDPLEAITRAFFGYRYNPYNNDHNEQFNPNDEYFAFNGNGNLISICEDDLQIYINDYIDRDWFIKWLYDNNHLTD